VVFASFIGASFAWGVGFYGLGVYLAELQRLHGWSLAVLSPANTLYYFSGALLYVFISDALKFLRPRLLLMSSAAVLALALVAIAMISQPWQLYATYLLMSAGWAGMSSAAIATTLSLWFTARRGLAISLALTGASIGGIVVAPLLLLASARFGFSQTMLITAALIVTIVWSVAWFCIGPPPAVATPAGTPALSGSSTRLHALRSARFWMATGPFALALMAQVAFLVHQIAFLEPFVGRDGAGLAVALTTGSALVGRLLLGSVIDRMNLGVFSALSIFVQSLAMLTMVLTQNQVALLAACAVFGFFVGNLITFPPLVIFREFGTASFAVLASLAAAVNQIVFAFGPGLAGILRDWWGSYALPFAFCFVLELAAVAIILLREARGPLKVP
jgi:predicted MFS family arabinose efflux permease